MGHVSKRARAIKEKADRSKSYPLADAFRIIKETATAKFDESVDVAVNLGIDAKKSDQAVRGSVVLPSGTGKTARVAVFAQGDKAKEALAAGADIVGFEDLAERIKGGDIRLRCCDRQPRCDAYRWTVGANTWTPRLNA